MTDPTVRLDELDVGLRRPTHDDTDRLFRLQAAIDTHDYGAVDMSPEDIRAELAEVSLETDAWLVEARDGSGDPMAYALLQPAELWLMALDGERVVATSTNSVIPGNLGWISGLGVVRSHRRRGLARAILLQALRDFWRRGQRSVALGVDADSLTGATRLYESAGMHVAEMHDQVRKVLREGATI